MISLSQYFTHAHSHIIQLVISPWFGRYGCKQAKGTRQLVTKVSRCVTCFKCFVYISIAKVTTMSTLITVGFESFQRSLPCGGRRWKAWGIRGRGFAIFRSEKLKLLTFHKEILIMPAIKNQVNGTNYNNNNMFIQYYRFYTWCYR